MAGGGTDMTPMDELIRAHFHAAAELVEAALAEAGAADPAGLDQLRQVVRAGGMLSLRSTIAPACGQARLVIEVMEPGGTTHQLMACNLKRETFQ